jgi:hypothetical protein
MTKKYQIWEQQNEWEEHGMLIPAEDITDMVYAENYSWYQIDGTTGNVDDLVEKLEAACFAAVDADEDFELADNDDLERFLQDTGIEFDSIDFVPDYAKPEEMLCYDRDNREFFNLASVETYPVYRWWDGSNWKHEFGDDESVTVTEVTVEDESTSLDEWDGNNHTCGGTGLHQCYYKVLEMDGEPVQDTYLLVRWSQWQGSHDTGEIMTKEQLDRHIAELHR